MKKVKMAMALALALALSSAQGVWAEETEMAQGQRKATIRVVSITGNELTYYEVENDPDRGEEQAQEKDTEQESETGQKDSRAGEPPEGFEPGQMGEGEPPEGFEPGPGKNETKTTYLPVSVKVHTNTEEEMGFSILQAGDELEVIFEETDGEEAIVEIWMTSGAGKET